MPTALPSSPRGRQNVVKHAGAAAASVVLRCDPGLVSLQIADDGAGFDPESAGDRNGFGLSGLAELVGGHLDVRSRSGRGITIEARVPGTARPGRLAAMLGS